MRKGINIWAFRDQSNLRACMAQARDAGFEGIELSYALQGPINPASTVEDMQAIVRLAEEAGVWITSLCAIVGWAHNLIGEDDAKRALCLQETAMGLEPGCRLMCQSRITKGNVKLDLD